MKQAEKFAPKKRAKMGRRPKGSPNWRLRFLEVLAVHGNVREAAQAAGISRRMTFKERALNEQFAFAWGLAKAEAADRMEAEAYRRAVDGVVRQRKVGDRIVEYREYSDTLLMFLLKGERPQKFRDDGLEGKLTVEEARSWTPEMIAAYRAGASLEECRLLGRVLRVHASEQGSDPTRGASL